jgi:mannitol 2-dehydrogenase
MVADVRPYELMKLRLLNASHQALAWLGTLAGYEFVHEAATDPVIARFVRAYMDDEATSTLDPVPGIDLDAYKDQLMRRFASPYVRDTLARIITDASDRIPKFLIPVVWARRAAGAPAALGAAVVAAWTRQAERYVNGEVESFHDRQVATVRAGIERMATDPAGFLRETDWFGDLAGDTDFVQDYEAALQGFRAEEPRVVIVPMSDQH